MIYTNSDGGSRGNPGPGAIGVIIRNEGEIITKFSGFIGENVTNNIAEYEALIMAMKMAIKHSDEIICVLDSELVVKQLMGEYKVKHPKMLEYFKEVQKLQDKYKKIKYIHASRWDKFQKMADELVNEELDAKGYKKKFKKE
jgi:ribonuclease HI